MNRAVISQIKVYHYNNTNTLDNEDIKLQKNEVIRLINS